jgi:hypothetical protein
MKKKLVVSVMLAALLAGSLACIGCSLDESGSGISIVVPEGGPKVGQTLTIDKSTSDEVWYMAGSKNAEVWVGTGSNNRSLLLTDNHEGKYIKVIARNKSSNAEEESAPVGPVKPAN